MNKFDDEVSIENLKRWQAESTIFANTELFHFGLKLRRIDISGDRNNHQHDDINKNSMYLIGIYGKWSISKASRQHYGWIFNDGLITMQLRNADFVYEILTSMEYDNRPLGRLLYSDEIDDE